jgi:hypothetical protein
MSLMPSCKDVTEHASDYLDRNMPLMQRMAFRVHLFICNNCSRYLSQLKLTIATLGKIEEAVPQPVDERQVQDIVEKMKQQSTEQK